MAMQVLQTLKQSQGNLENNQKLNINIGVIHQRQGQLDKAEEYLERAVNGTDDKQDQFISHFNLAMTYMQSNKMDQALNNLHQALTLIEQQEESPEIT